MSVSIGGYAGKFLRLDLTKERFIEEEADDEIQRQIFITAGMDQ